LPRTAARPPIVAANYHPGTSCFEYGNKKNIILEKTENQGLLTPNTSVFINTNDSACSLGRKAVRRVKSIPIMH